MKYEMHATESNLGVFHVEHGLLQLKITRCDLVRWLGPAFSHGSSLREGPVEAGSDVWWVL